MRKCPAPSITCAVTPNLLGESIGVRGRYVRVLVGTDYRYPFDVIAYGADVAPACDVFVQIQ